MGLDVANLLLRISGDEDDAKRALLEITTELKKFGETDEQAKIGIKGYDDAKAKLDDIEKSLTVLGGRDVTAKVKINVDEAKARLQQLRKELDLTAAGGAGALPGHQVLGGIDSLGSDLEHSLDTPFEKLKRTARDFFHDLGTDLGSTLRRAASSAFQGAAGAGATAFGAVLEGFGAAGKGVISLGSSALGAIGPMGALLGIILLFAPALVALVASLTGAIAGFTVLAASFVGTLAPAVLLVVAAVKELTQAYTAVGEQQKSEKENTEKLASAQKNLKEQTANAYEAWRQQIRSVREDLLGVQQAQLGTQSATLRYKEALQSLQEFRNQTGLSGGSFDDLFKKFTNVDFDPSKILKSIKDAGGGELGHKQDLELQQLILSIKEAKLGEAQAQNSLHSSNEKLEKDRRVESKYLKEGIKAYPAYVSALKELQTAQNSQSKPLQGLSKEQVELGKSLHSFVNDLKNLLAPATNEIFKGLKSGLKDVLDLLKDSQLNAAFRTLGRTIGEVFSNLGKTLSSPEVRKNLVELVKGASQLVKVLGSSILTSFIRLFTNLAVAAMPAMLKLVERIGAGFKKWADGSSNIEKLREKISHIINEFGEWMHLIKTLANLIKAFFHDASGEGDSLTRSLAKVFEHWTAFLETKAGQEEVKKFLQESIHLGKEFIEVVKDIIEAVEKLTSVFSPVVEGIESVAEYFGERYAETSAGTEDAEKNKAASKSERERTISSVDKQLKSGKTTHGEPLTPVARKRLEQLRSTVEKEMHPTKRSVGGLIGGWGGGDHIPVLAEGGEYMLRKEVVNSVGQAALDRLNGSGSFPRRNEQRGGDTYIDKVVLPTVPGAPALNPRVAAVKFAKELSRRGLTG